MDPSSTTTAFATIVSLLADFAGQRDRRTGEDYREFVLWLGENRHTELIELLTQNAATAISIKALLNQDREILREKLDGLDRMLASVASAIEEFRPLAASVWPGSGLSEQALRILREFYDSGAGKAVEMATFSGRTLLLIEGGTGEIRFDELRFVDDDLNALVESGLLRLDYNSRGNRVFVFTRFAAEYVERLRGGTQR